MAKLRDMTPEARDRASYRAGKACAARGGDLERSRDRAEAAGHDMTAWAAGFHDCLSGHARGEAGSFEQAEVEQAEVEQVEQVEQAEVEQAEAADPARAERLRVKAKARTASRRIAAAEAKARTIAAEVGPLDPEARRANAYVEALSDRIGARWVMDRHAADPDQIGDPADRYDGLYGDRDACGRPIPGILAELGARESGQPWGHDLLAKIGREAAEEAAEADKERRKRIGTETVRWADPATGEARQVTDLPGAISGPGTARMLAFSRPQPDTRSMRDRRPEVIVALAETDPRAALALARMARPDRKARGDMSGREMTLPRSWQITPDPITRVRLTSDRPMAPQGRSGPAVLIRLDKGQGRFRGAEVVKLLSGSERTSQTVLDGVRDRRVYLGQGAWLVWSPQVWRDDSCGLTLPATAEAWQRDARCADCNWTLTAEALAEVEGPTPAEVTAHKRGKFAHKAHKALTREAGRRDDKAHALTLRADMYAAEARARGVRVRTDKADKAETATATKGAKAGPAKGRQAMTDAERAELAEALARLDVSAERIAELTA